MKKILVTLTSTLITTAVLVACNASTDDSDSSVGKAVCTSGNNWQSVSIGMTASDLESRLGKPATITSTTAGTTYTYERCRAGLFVKTAATTTTEAEYTVLYFGGSVVFSNNKGVSAINSPKLDSDLSMSCEYDLYNYPNNYGGSGGSFVCRSATNPF